ncbi:MAG TPA: hypothetical protein VE863_01350 [Pyrinomonadaceae bacterium]|nr:hypothetical protein [Pyrinomonadaceae bacterium]
MARQDRKPKLLAAIYKPAMIFRYCSSLKAFNVSVFTLPCWPRASVALA